MEVKRKRGRPPKKDKTKKAPYKKKKQEYITKQQLEEWEANRARAKKHIGRVNPLNANRHKGKGGRINRNDNPIKHNNVVQEMIRVLNEHGGSMNMTEILYHFGHLRKKNVHKIIEYPIEGLPLRMKRLRKNSVEWCLMHPKKWDSLPSYRKYEFMATYAMLDLYYYFYDTHDMFFFNRPFNVDVTLHLTTTCFAPVGEYAYLLQKIYMWCFRYYNLIPYHGKFYFNSFNVKLGSVRAGWEFPTYDIHFKTLTDQEIRDFYKNNKFKKKFQNIMYKHNAMKKKGLMDLSARPQPKLWAKKYKTNVLDNDENLDGLTEESRDCIINNG